MEKVIIAGTGPAGLTAALYCARAEMEPLVIDGLQPGGQLTTTTEVENYPGFVEPIFGSELVENMRKQAERFGARYRQGEVTGSDLSGFPLRVTVDNRETIETATLIVATGARARYLGLESEQQLIGRGVSGCATCDGAFFRNVPVAVVGGGDTAMEDALFLSRMASRVTIIHRRDELRASKIMGDRVKENDKIDIMWDTVVDEVLGVEQHAVKGLRVHNVKTGEAATLDVEGFFVAIGHTPNVQAFRDYLEVDERGFIVTDNTRTAVKGVFAAGDVQDPFYKQAVTAAGSGCKAALEVERYLSAQGLGA